MDNRDIIKTPESYLSRKLQNAGINAVVYKLTDNSKLVHRYDDCPIEGGELCNCEDEGCSCVITCHRCRESLGLPHMRADLQEFQIEWPDGRIQKLNDDTRKPRFGRFNEASQALNVFIRQEKAKKYVEQHSEDYKR